MLSMAFMLNSHVVAVLKSIASSQIEPKYSKL